MVKLSDLKKGTKFTLDNGTNYYRGKTLVITRKDRTGIVAEDVDEGVSALSTKVKHMFGMPPLKYYLSNGLIKIIKESRNGKRNTSDTR